MTSHGARRSCHLLRQNQGGDDHQVWDADDTVYSVCCWNVSAISSRPITRWPTSRDHARLVAAADAEDLSAPHSDPSVLRNASIDTGFGRKAFMPGAARSKPGGHFMKRGPAAMHRSESVKKACAVRATIGTFSSQPDCGSRPCPPSGQRHESRGLQQARP